MHFVVWFPGHPPHPSDLRSVFLPSFWGKEKNQSGLPFPHFGGKGPGDGGLFLGVSA